MESGVCPWATYSPIFIALYFQSHPIKPCLVEPAAATATLSRDSTVLKQKKKKGGREEWRRNECTSLC